MGLWSLQTPCHIWNPINPSDLNVNDIGLLNFADAMNIVCDKHVNYNQRLDDIDS